VFFFAECEKESLPEREGFELEPISRRQSRESKSRAQSSCDKGIVMPAVAGHRVVRSNP
jgi:hypothetical protein